MSQNRYFFSFEGIEGSGKTTQCRLLGKHLKSKGFDVVETAEPGGTVISSKIRQILLEPGNQIDPLTELLLYYSSRAQLVSEVIRPSLEQGRIVITDRFTDSTLAYQGYGRGIEKRIIQTLNDIVVPDIRPSLTFLLDLDVEEGLRRNRGAGKEDRFETEAIEFHRRVREGFLEIASQEPERIKVIDASRSPEEIHQEIIKIIEELPWDSET